MKESEKQERMTKIIQKMKELYPDASCALQWDEEPWKLLIMARLSAQCTDARVNTVCKKFFADYPSPEMIAELPVEIIEQYVRSCGLYHVKAQNTKDQCILLTKQYHGRLPDTMEELLKFPGVGRKVANLLLGDVYGKGGVVTDTHCIRICGRFGMYSEDVKDPYRVEQILTKLIPDREQSAFCHRIVQFGRDRCTARAPVCYDCPLKNLCEHPKNDEKKAKNR